MVIKDFSKFPFSLLDLLVPEDHLM